MSDASDKKEQMPKPPPRVLADFGGRRKIFERRLEQGKIKQFERRSGCDRRSGFDRRSAVLDDREKILKIPIDNTHTGND